MKMQQYIHVLGWGRRDKGKINNMFSIFGILMDYIRYTKQQTNKHSNPIK
jgi:hypothetical protein